MANNTKNHQLPIWTEVEYTALCKNPFIDTPFFIPKESKVFLCREDGSREEQRMIFLVFKSTAAAEDAEWEDDPIPGEMWVKPLEDDDTEEYEPAKIIYLGQDNDDFIKVVNAHQKGEISLWEEEEEQRKEILHLFSTFHSPFVEILESLKDEETEEGA